MEQNQVIHQIANATTRSEIADARRVWREWTAAHADDEFVISLAYLLDCAEEVACKRAAEWEALEIKMKTQGAARLSSDEAARIGMSASSLEEIAHARQVLREWEQAHPEERKMPEVYEMLYIREGGWRTEAAEQSALAA